MAFVAPRISVPQSGGVIGIRRSLYKEKWIADDSFRLPMRGTNCAPKSKESHSSQRQLHPAFASSNVTRMQVTTTVTATTAALIVGMGAT